MDKKKEQALTKLKLKKLEQLEKLQRKHDEAYKLKVEKLEARFKAKSEQKLPGNPYAFQNQK